MEEIGEDGGEGETVADAEGTGAGAKGGAAASDGRTEAGTEKREEEGYKELGARKEGESGSGESSGEEEGGERAVEPGGKRRKVEEISVEGSSNESDEVESGAGPPVGRVIKLRDRRASSQ